MSQARSESLWTKVTRHEGHRTPTRHARAEVIPGWGGVAWPHGQSGAQPANLFSVSRSKVKTRSRMEDEASRGSKRGCFCLHQVGMKWHTLTSVTFPKQDCRQGFPGDSVGENLPASSGTRVLSLIREDPVCPGPRAAQPEQPRQREASLALPESSPRAHSQRKAHTVTGGSQK